MLGARFTSRLNTALRIESGLTYGARSAFDDERSGSFSVRTFTETSRSKETIDLARATVSKFVESGLTQEELDSAKAYVMGQYAPDNLETVEQRVATLLDLHAFGLPRTHVEGLFARLAALSLDDVNSVIKKHFPAAPWTWVLIGQAGTLRPIAKELGDVTEIKLSDPGFGPR